MKIKAAFFDIDGTLMDQGVIPGDTREALRRLGQQGILIFVSSGRHILEIENLPVNEITFDGYVLLNGQICLDRDRKRLYASPINLEDIQKVLPIFEKKEIPLMFVEEDRIYINCINDKVRTAHKAITTELPRVEAYEGAPVYQANVFSDKKDTDYVMAQMAHSKMTRWNPYAVDIIPKSGGKKSGMDEILKHWDFSWEDVIAFGDGENDIQMLKAAGLGIAMGNAETSVKECADYVTGDVDKGGILDALKYFQILN